MDYIKRDLEDLIPALSEKYPCVLVTGPRQAGKTTLLKRLMNEKRSYVNLEDFEERRVAKKDPVLFLQIVLRMLIHADLPRRELYRRMAQKRESG